MAGSGSPEHQAQLCILCECTYSCRLCGPIENICLCASVRGDVRRPKYAITLQGGHAQKVSSLTAACSELSAFALFLYGGAKSAALSLRHVHEDSLRPGAQVATLYEPLQACTSHHRHAFTSGLNPVSVTCWSTRHPISTGSALKGVHVKEATLRGALQQRCMWLPWG